MSSSRPKERRSSQQPVGKQDSNTVTPGASIADLGTTVTAPSQQKKQRTRTTRGSTNNQTKEESDGPAGRVGDSDHGDRDVGGDESIGDQEAPPVATAALADATAINQKLAAALERRERERQATEARTAATLEQKERERQDMAARLAEYERKDHEKAIAEAAIAEHENKKRAKKRVLCEPQDVAATETDGSVSAETDGSEPDEEYQSAEMASVGSNGSRGNRVGVKRRPAIYKRPRTSGGLRGRSRPIASRVPKLTAPSTRQVEGDYLDAIVQVKDLSATKSAEMRKYAVLAWHGARMIGHEDKRRRKAMVPEYRAIAVYLTRKVLHFIHALDRFHKSKEANDVRIKEINDSSVEFAANHGGDLAEELAEKSRKWLPVPNAGNGGGYRDNNGRLGGRPSVGGGMSSRGVRGQQPYVEGGYSTNNYNAQAPATSWSSQMTTHQAAANATYGGSAAMQPAPYQVQPQGQFYQQYAPQLQLQQQQQSMQTPQQQLQQQQQTTPVAQQQQQPMQQMQQAQQLPTFNRQRGPPGLCHFCNEPGHYMAQCSLKAAAQELRMQQKAAAGGAMTGRAPSTGTAMVSIRGASTREEEVQDRDEATDKRVRCGVSSLDACIANSKVQLQRSSGQGECKCGQCGECQQGIDIMTKEEKESKAIPSKKQTAEARSSMQAAMLTRVEQKQQSTLGAIVDEVKANSANSDLWTRRMEGAKESAWEKHEDDVEDEVSGRHVPLQDSEGGPPPAPQRLRDYMRGLSFKKKTFDKYAKQCTFCKRKGHARRTCMAAPPEKGAGLYEAQTELQKRKEAFVMGLIERPSNKRTSSKDITGKPGERLRTAKAVIERGREANEGNPWKDSTKRRDKLRKNLGYWWSIGADKTVLGWIGFGVRLSPETEPSRTAFGNHKSYETEKEHIQEEHEKHVTDGSFKEVNGWEVHACNPLQVEVNVKGKRRQCLDMRYVNSFLADYTFTQETLQKHVAEIVRLNDWMVTTDVEKAYYQVPLHKDSQRYCAWRHNGKWIVPTILPFGLSVAPFVFTKIMRPVLTFMRSLDIRGTNCIDDNLWAAPEKDMPEVKEIVKLVFDSLGWVFNAKCEWDSTTEVVYNGMWVDSKRFEIRATEEKIEAARKLAWVIWYAAQRGEQVYMKDLQRLAGRLQSMRLALEGVAPWTRGLYGAIAREMEECQQRLPPLAKTWLDMKALEDINFWAYRLGKQNGLPIRDEGKETHIAIRTDASDVGWGAHIDGGESAYGALATDVLGSSSTAREIMAVIQACTVLVQHLRGRRVQIAMDSYPAFRNLINGGGSIEELNTLVREWWVWCRVHRVTPLYKWVPREENTLADALSKAPASSWALMRSTETKIREWLVEEGEPGMDSSRWKQTVIQTPSFNCVAVRLEEMRRARRPGCIVVPRWPGAPWQMRLKEVSEARLVLGEYQRCTTEQGAGEMHGWVMVAHLIIPERRSTRSAAACQ